MSPAIVWQMITAEILKLRRNRSVMAFALVLSVGVLVLLFGVTAIQHASNPRRYGPAGGADGFKHAVTSLALFFGMLAAILIGSEAGTADLSSGVFRDLVATGRSRLALFAVRAPAAILITLAFSAAGFALSLIASFVFAGGAPTPSLTMILQSAGWIVVANALLVGFAVGVGSLTGSRAMTLTAVIGWQVVATSLLLNIGSLGSVRDGLLTAALQHLSPFPGDRGGVTMTTAVAVAVLCGWAMVPSAIGAWRTRTRDA
jgi:ABC-type transport system involved in multi-copper enzyme maturation permease subunit